MRLLLLSNSTNSGEAYLKYPINQIKDFLGEKPVNALFIPFAAVTVSFDEYEQKVRDRFSEIGHSITSIHQVRSMTKAVKKAEAIIIGGGNTFQLLKFLQQNNLLDIIRKKVRNGTPYLGWSAGSNVACPSIRTTNDMPILEPKGFKAMGLVPFQINPHYTDIVPVGHVGETRDQRIAEFMAANPDKIVVGLWEGTMLSYTDDKLRLIGDRPARIFKYQQQPVDLYNTDDFSFLMK